MANKLQLYTNTLMSYERSRILVKVKYKKLAFLRDLGCFLITYRSPIPISSFDPKIIMSYLGDFHPVPPFAQFLQRGASHDWPSPPPPSPSIWQSSPVGPCNFLVSHIPCLELGHFVLFVLKVTVCKYRALNTYIPRFIFSQCSCHD